MFTCTLLCMVAWNTGDETFPKLLNLLRLLLPFFFFSSTSNTRDNGQYSCCCCVLFLRPLRFLCSVWICSLCACVRARVLACEWLAWSMYVSMYVTARSGPLYVCVTYVKPVVCAPVADMYAASEPSGSRDITKKERKKEKKGKSREMHLFPKILPKSIAVAFKQVDTISEAEIKCDLKMVASARKVTRSG